MPRRLLLAAVLPVSLAACTDPVKVSEEKAQVHVERVASLVAADVKEMRTGLPEGAKKLVPNLFEGAEKDILPGRARAALKKTREQVIVLQLAKATFFSVTDPAGVAYASDQETDAFVGKNLLTSIPGLEKARIAGFAEATGQMEEARGLRTGDDAVWAAASKITAADGALKGFYVSGWSFRRFAEHLERQLTSDLRNEIAKAEKPSKTPLLYVFVLMGSKAYGTPIAPEVNQKALEDLALPAKLTGDTIWHGRMEITNRGFGVAAKKTPDLCESCAVAVLRSEI